MRTEFKSISDNDLERIALDYALTKLLSQQAKDSVLSYFASNHLLSLESGYPLSRRKIENALERYFKAGAAIIMAEYDGKFYQLVSKKESVA